jgi:hypothetical protein
VKLRNVVWPVVILGALSLSGACSSDGGTSNGGGATGGDAAEGGGDGNGTAGKDGGGSKNTSGSASGGASDGGSGGEPVAGGSTGGAAAGAAGAGSDLCVDSDLTCEDDGNPCTEDECNPATGKCGIPRTGTSCDDGLYCNGEDSCSDGKCTEHEGDPCNGQTCNEAEDYCECAGEEDCPADEAEAFSECDFGPALCTEAGKKTRAVKTFTCTDGKCVQGAKVEEEDCARETDGLSCDDALRCNGTDKCKNGNCDHSGNPCAAGGADADGCWETNTMCRACGVGAACSGIMQCCNSGGTTASCKNNCFVINPDFIGDIIINPQP